MIMSILTETKMANIKFTNLTIFVLFFGLALFEAMQKKNWFEAGIFASLGILSLWGDFVGKKSAPPK